MVATLSLALWILFLAVTATGTWALFRQVRRPTSSGSLSRSFRDQGQGFPGLSILKPLKGAEPSLESNLESFFKAETAIPFELLFSIESTRDTAYPLLTRLIWKYPEINSRVFILEQSKLTPPSGKNPKLKNVNESFENARYDAILISDSNVLLKKGELEALISELDEETGIVTAIVSATSFRGLGGALESVFLGTFYARFMALCNRFAKPCVVGKAMLFRKSQSERFGGLRLLSEFLAEDFMAGESMRKLGLKVKTSCVPVTQILGNYSFGTFWARHVRWGRIRKSHAPLAFFVEPIFGSLPMGLIGAYGLQTGFSLPFGLGLLGSWMFLCILDGLCYLRTTECSVLFTLGFPVFWTIREVLALPLWIKIASGNGIDWRGNRFTLAPGGLLRD